MTGRKLIKTELKWHLLRFHLYLSLRAFKVQETWSQVTWLLALQTPILIGCKFLMILARPPEAFATRLQTVCCDQRSLKLYTAFKAVVKFSFWLFLCSPFKRQQTKKQIFELETKRPAEFFNWANVAIRAWRWPTFTRESALSSALSRFTVLFGMGRSGTNLLWSSGITVVTNGSTREAVHRIHRANQL